MPTSFLSTFSRRVAVLLLAVLLQASGVAAAGLQVAGPAGLRTLHENLAPALANNQFKGPLVLQSDESPGTLQGDVYAVVDHPFASVSAALNDPGHWCDVLILHLNVKYCRRKDADAATRIELRIGKKHDQPLASATPVAFAWRAAAPSNEYMQVQLEAPDGPFDTRNYRILLEAVSIESGRTFLHMGYSFSYGAASRLAMQVYLATVARDKVGFTPSRPAQPGQPADYIGGLRGLVERNTMRYYLAIDAYLGALSAPAADQFEKRAQGWFEATEKYPRQLHEVERDEYLAMKRSEYRRQQAPS
jgi:hypothetical protein